MERRDEATVFDGKVVRRKAAFSDGMRERDGFQKTPFPSLPAERKEALLSRDSRCGCEVLCGIPDAR
jgi:hypothetical protein